MLRKRGLFLFFAGMLVCLPALAVAEESLASLTRSLETFIKSPDSRFAPETAARAQAILGAALMAGRRHDLKAQNESIQAAAETLASARKLVRDFKSKYSDVLRFEQAATEAAGGIPGAQTEAIKSHVQVLIQAFEHGDLNQAVKLSDNAKTALKAFLDSKLPALLDQTGSALVTAARGGAKRYAPLTYAAAQTWLSGALAYTDGVSNKWPGHPRLGLKLAGMAREMARQAKEWRKHAGSYESLLMQARQDRRKIAGLLDIGVDKEDPTADVDVNVLLRRINTLKSDLARERRDHKADVARLEEAHVHAMKEKITELQNEMSQRQSKQVGELKEAFRAKLERETFESRRRQQLHKLFRKGEVKILANLDGSLLIRLSALKFAPGSSAIRKKYFGLLSQVKAGLEQYPERKVSIEGHTDNKGDPKANQKLSLKRAETVRDFLIAAGMPGGRLKALGYGVAHPVASNDYERGRAMNRRIDIIIQARSPSDL